jgi:hypothetical protein
MGKPLGNQWLVFHASKTLDEKVPAERWQNKNSNVPIDPALSIPPIIPDAVRLCRTCSSEYLSQ